MDRNKKDHWDSGKPRRKQILFCDIQIKVWISRRQIYYYVYHTDLLPLKILSDLDFDLSRSLKVKFDHSAIGLPIYGFLLMFNSNIGPN